MKQLAKKNFKVICQDEPTFKKNSKLFVEMSQLSKKNFKVIPWDEPTFQKIF